MNTRQKSKSEMYQTVGQVCDDEAGIISEIAAFQTAVNQFKAIFAQILETEQIRSQPLTGITAGKSADRANLTKTAAAVAGFLSAYASVTKNAALKSDVNFSNSKLLLMREDMLVQTAQNIHDLGTANAAALKDYGVTAAKSAELQTAIDAFKISMLKPRTAKDQKATLTVNRDELFAQMDDILINQMDFLVKNFEQTHPDFVRKYRQARKIKDPATVKTQLKGVVTTKSEGLPIKGASITIVELGLSTKTRANGEYHFKPIDQGEFTIKANATGFQDFEKDEVRITKGEVNKLDILLII